MAVCVAPTFPFKSDAHHTPSRRQRNARSRVDIGCCDDFLRLPTLAVTSNQSELLFEYTFTIGVIIRLK